MFFISTVRERIKKIIMMDQEEHRSVQAPLLSLIMDNDIIWLSLQRRKWHTY